MTDYLLVRHGSAESSAGDARLTPRGQSEAAALARRLQVHTFDAAWSSDLGRAAETTGILLAGRDAPEPALSPLLREVDPPAVGLLAGNPVGYAEWERRATRELAEKLSTWLRTAEGRGDGFPLPLGEGQGEGGSFKDPLTYPHPPLAASPRGRGDTGVGRDGRAPSTILVVSHAGPLRVLICLLLGLPPEAHWSFHLDCASLSVVRRGEDMGTIMLLNDRCHLDGELTL